jgi:hypothetical protein
MANGVRLRPRANPRADSDHARSRGAGRSGMPVRNLFAGGTEGNERLTVLSGLLLIVLLAVLGLTIVDLGGLLWLHLFLGLALIGPVVLKMASTGYRFLRYYTHHRRYRVKGPPAPALRLLAPLVVATTVLVFLSGVVLLFIGPDSGLRGKVFLIHKASFIVWIGAVAIHVLGHLPEILRFLRLSNDSRREVIAARSSRGRRAGQAAPAVGDRLPGGSGRWLSIASALVLGFVLAVALIPDFATWTGSAGAAVIHHHHHFHH